MNWLREWLRRWLGVERQERQLAMWMALVSNHSDELRQFDKWQIEVNAALRGKPSQPPRKTVVYSDYETSQQIALKDFEEK